jgi:hypothetical protein
MAFYDDVLLEVLICHNFYRSGLTLADVYIDGTMGLHLIKTAYGTVLCGHTAIASNPLPADKIAGAGHKNAGDAYGKKDPRHNLNL